jgi:hypothetical protein
MALSARLEYLFRKWIGATEGTEFYDLLNSEVEVLDSAQTVSGVKTFSADPQTSVGVGAKNGTGVTVVENGNGAVHKTVLTLAATSITMTDAGAAGSHGSLKVYDFPAGPIQVLGCSYNLTTLAGAGGISDTAALVGSLGSATVATDNATLVGTGEADLIASTTGTLTGGAGALAKHGSLVATAYDGTATAIDAYLNLAVPDAGSSANDTIAVSGTITIHWVNLGDY